MAGWIVTCLLFMALPGPDMALVTSWVLRRGPAAAWTAVLGINLSFLIYAVLCLAGAAALIYKSPEALTILRLLGGGYLLFLAVSSLRSASKSGEPPRGGSPLASGFVSNLLNPKQVIFLVAVMPAFLPGPEPQDLLLLLGVLLVVSLLFWAAWIYGLSGVASRLPESRLQMVRYVVAGGLFVLGLMLAGSAF